MSVAFSMKRQQLDLGYAVWGNRAGTRPPESGAAAGSRTSSSGLRKNAISVFSEEELIMRWLRPIGGDYLFAAALYFRRAKP
jgi:hypothetical protein